MDRQTLIRKIEEFTRLNKLNHCLFAISGDASNFLLGDIPSLQYPVVEIALSTQFQQESLLVPDNGIQFNLIHHHGKWASITNIPETKLFVVSTYDRIGRRNQKNVKTFN